MPVPPKALILTTVATTATADKRTPLRASIAIHFLVHRAYSDSTRSNSCDNRRIGNRFILFSLGLGLNP